MLKDYINSTYYESYYTFRRDIDKMSASSMVDLFIFRNIHKTVMMDMENFVFIATDDALRMLRGRQISAKRWCNLLKHKYLSSIQYHGLDRWFQYIIRNKSQYLLSGQMNHFCQLSDAVWFDSNAELLHE